MKIIIYSTKVSIVNMFQEFKKSCIKWNQIIALLVRPVHAKRSQPLNFHIVMRLCLFRGETMVARHCRKRDEIKYSYGNEGVRKSVWVAWRERAFQLM